MNRLTVGHFVMARCLSYSSGAMQFDMWAACTWDQAHTCSHQALLLDTSNSCVSLLEGRAPGRPPVLKFMVFHPPVRLLCHHLTFS
jgi:hypothetical protein